MEIDALSGLKGTDLIQETFLFRMLNFEETLELASLFRREERKKGDAIIEEGELGQALYLIEKGTVKIVKGETEREIAALGRGELFGEMSLIENELTSAGVIATSNVDLLVVLRPDFERLLESNLGLALKVYKTFCHTLSERLRKTSAELSRLKGESAGGSAKAASASRDGKAKKEKAKRSVKPRKSGGVKKGQGK